MLLSVSDSGYIWRCLALFFHLSVCNINISDYIWRILSKYLIGFVVVINFYTDCSNFQLHPHHGCDVTDMLDMIEPVLTFSVHYYEKIKYKSGVNYKQ